MKSIPVKYHVQDDTIEMIDDTTEENWIDVCDRYTGDVQRMRDVTDQGEYTGLYDCRDEENQPVYYLVIEDPELFRMKRKFFLRNIGH